MADGDVMGLDLADSREVEVEGYRWRVGLVPFTRLETLRMRLLRAREAWLAAEGDARDEHALALSEALAEIVRWGLRGWPSAEPLPTEPETFGGRTFALVSRPILDRLCHVRGGALVSDLAVAVLDANRLDEATLLGFPSRSTGAPSGI
jgi:hypothetical protein